MGVNQVDVEVLDETVESWDEGRGEPPLASQQMNFYAGLLQLVDELAFPRKGVGHVVAEAFPIPEASPVGDELLRSPDTQPFDENKDARCFDLHGLSPEGRRVARPCPPRR